MTFQGLPPTSDPWPNQQEPVDGVVPVSAVPQDPIIAFVLSTEDLEMEA